MAQTARPLLLSGFMNNIRVGTSRGVLALAESDFRRRYPVPQFARGGRKSMNDIVWLHGLYECKEVFANQVDGETMSQHFRQIAIDLPGHGGSDNTPDSYSISAVSDLVVEVLTKLNVVDVTLVGSDVGAAIALDVVKKFSGGVRGLWLNRYFPDPQRYLSSPILPYPSPQEVDKVVEHLVSDGTKNAAFLKSAVERVDKQAVEALTESFQQYSYEKAMSVLNSVKFAVAIYPTKGVVDKKDVDALKLQHRYKMIGIRSMTAPYLEAPSDFNGTFCRFIQETYRFDIDQAKEKFQALD